MRGQASGTISCASLCVSFGTGGARHELAGAAQSAYAAEPPLPVLLVDDRTSRGGASKLAATKEEIERLKQEAQQKDEELKRLREELAKKQAATEGARAEKPRPEEGFAGAEQRQRSFFTPKGF